MAAEPAKAGATAPSARGARSAGMLKALVSLAGIALLFAAFTVAFMVLVPDSAGVPKTMVSLTAISVVGALLIALLVIAVIFAVMYLLESRTKMPFEDRIRAAERHLHHVSSPRRAVLAIIFTLVWMVVMYFFWDQIPIVIEETNGVSTTTMLFSNTFGAFVPFFLVLGVGTIIVNILYLIIKNKWVLMAGEITLYAGAMLLLYWVIQAFPFNNTPSDLVRTLTYVVLVVMIIGLALGSITNLQRMLRVILYGDEKSKESA